MPQKYFARFSRVIALFVLDLSERTVKCIPNQFYLILPQDFMDLSPNYHESKIISKHSFLLSIPNLVETYVSVLENLKEIIQCWTSINTMTISKKILVQLLIKNLFNS